jgi:hypothetical protein
LGLGGCLGEGDVETGGLEVAEAGADLAVAVGLALVPPGARSRNLAPGSDSRCQTMTRTDLPAAH